MPISAKEALDKVNSLELLGNELKWFERLCLYTDFCIDNFFNGNSVNIPLEDAWLDDPINKNSKINCMATCWQISAVRQGVVIKVWMSVYENMGWSVTPVGNDWSYYNSKYQFKVDKRDLKLKELLD